MKYVYSKLQEIEIVAKAAMHRGQGYCSKEHMEQSVLPQLGFKMPEDRQRLLNYIAIDDGRDLKSQHGVGTCMFQAILMYLFYTPNQ